MIMDGKVLIHDYKELVHLKDAMDYCGDSFIKILSEVDGYLKSCMRAFEGQRDVLKEQLDRAGEELSAAENALSSCESSQEWDEEDECYHPSCNAEKRHVESARRHRDECQRKYDEACRIVSDCAGQIERYKEPGGFFTPPGGEKTLEYLARQHTKDGIGKMDAILDVVVKEYLGRTIQETPVAESLPTDKTEQFKKASEAVKEKQKEESAILADANVSMICPGCKRPYPICVCARNRERTR